MNSLSAKKFMPKSPTTGTSSAENPGGCSLTGTKPSAKDIPYPSPLQSACAVSRYITGSWALKDFKCYQQGSGSTEIQIEITEMRSGAESSRALGSGILSCGATFPKRL